MKAGDIKNAYNALGKAKTTTLTDQERMAIARIRRILRPVATELNDYEQELVQTLKSPNFDELAAKENAGGLKGKELEEWRLTVLAYNRALAAELKAAHAKEEEVTIAEPLLEATVMKMITENEWPMAYAEALEIITKV